MGSPVYNNFRNLITFSRGTNATLFDSTGKLTFGASNITLYSEQFDNAYWTKLNLNTTGTPPWVNAATAPDGTLTADAIIENTSNSQHAIVVASASRPTIGSGNYVHSIYLKAAGRTSASVYNNGTSGGAGAVFDLTSGTVTSTGGTQYVSSSIQSVGNGWYRVSITFLSVGGTAGLTVYLGTEFAGQTYTGDGVSGMYIWGAQTEAVTYQTTPSEYIPTVASAVYRPRLDYDPVTLALRGMLVEEQRINLLLRSEDFSNATWAKTALNTTGTPAWVNVGISPDGTQTADSLIEDTTNNIHTVEQFSSVSASTAYTHSFFFKRNVGNRDAFIQVNITGSSGILGAGFAWFGLTGNGTASSITTLSGTFSGTSATITPVGGSWYRCTLSFTSNVGATGVTAYIGPYNGARSYIGDGSSILIWGAQLEAGAFATSYIPTDGNTRTRNADNATMSGSQFTPWYNGTQGTLVSVGTWTSISQPGTSGMASLSSGASANSINVYRSGTGPIAVGVVSEGGGTTASFFPSLTAQPLKGALAYASGNTNFALNGLAGTTNTAMTIMPSGVNVLDIGGLYNSGGFKMNGWVRSITYYPRRLSNTQLQRLTA